VIETWFSLTSPRARGARAAEQGQHAPARGTVGRVASGATTNVSGVLMWRAETDADSREDQGGPQYWQELPVV
jgi:hypothetical protein